MKKAIISLLVAILLLCCASNAWAAVINLSRIRARDTFSYDDDKNTAWTYYQVVRKDQDDGSYVDILVAQWGDKKEMSGYPEFRVFASTKTNTPIMVQSATFIVDGNMFELSFEDLTLEKSKGVYSLLTSDAVPFMRALATSKSVSAVLHYADGSVPVSYTKDEMAPVVQFMQDMLNMDFLNHISRNVVSNESEYKKRFPVRSYLFNEDAPTGHLESEQPVQQSSESGWTEHVLGELGMKVYLPSDYMILMRGMSPDDPTLKSIGLTPAEVDQFLADGNLYLDGFVDDFSSEVTVTMIGSMLSDFASMTDSTLRLMSDMWTSSYASIGMEILDKDVFSCNDVKYVRMHQRQTGNDGGFVYRIQYYTVKNNQAINLVFISADDDVTEPEKEFMQTVVERAVFGLEITASDSNAFAQDAGNFTYTVLEDGTACITGYQGLNGTVAIPETVDGYTVSSLTVMEKDNGIISVFIPDSVTNMDGNPFCNLWSLKQIAVSETNPAFSSEDGILYSRDGHELICYPIDHDGEEFAVPAQVTRIGKEAFRNAWQLAQLTLPDGLLEIGDYAFDWAVAIPVIKIPSSVATIGVNPFTGMSSLEEIIVDSKNKTFTVQQGALYNRKTKTLIAYPRKYAASSFAFRDDVVEIGESAFEKNSNKLVITFPDSVRRIGKQAFYDCKNMTFTNFPVAMTYLGTMAFCSASIESATIPGTIQMMGNACFNGSALKTVTICSGVKDIPDGTFVACDGLEEVTLPETIVSIGKGAFRVSTNLKTVNIPASVTSIGENAFEKDDQLTALVVKGSVGENYCAENRIPYQYYEPDLSANTSLREYLLKDGPLTVTLDENKYNVLVRGMDTSEPAVIRSGVSADFFDTFMSVNDRSLLMFDINDHVPAEFDITIKIKDKQYEDIDLRKCSVAEARMILNLIYSSFESTASDKEIVTINGVPYLKFRWMDGSELRYATIVDGDMIYIWGKHDDTTLTDDEADILRQVVESIQYPDSSVKNLFNLKGAA